MFPFMFDDDDDGTLGLITQTSLHQIDFFTTTSISRLVAVHNNKMFAKV